MSGSLQAYETRSEELAARLLHLCTGAGISVSTAESCTGGMVAAAITAIAGASTFFLQGAVVYSNEAKMRMLGVQKGILEKYGAVSEEVALAMARGARERFFCDIALSITGIAGPGGSEFKPEGRVCFGIVSALGARTETIEFGAVGRANVRQAASLHGLTTLITEVENIHPNQC